MFASIDRRRVLRLGIGLGAACLWPGARAHEYFVPHIRISHPWCRETAADAPFAIVCMTFDEVTRSDRLVKVETPVAERAEIGGRATGPVDVEIVEGRTTELGEAGVHVRLVGLKQALVLGRSYPLTLVFAQSGAVEATLDVAYQALSK